MLRTMSNTEILTLIAEKQAIQKRYPVTHPMWQRASVILGELFSEMARRSTLK
jgi:hypothetical protein